MNKQIVAIIILTFLIPSCNGLKPLNDQNPIFGEKKIDKKKKEVVNSKKIKLFKSEEIRNTEFNSTLQINLENSFINSKRIINLDNNVGRYDYDGELIKKSNYKFSKIKNFNQNEPKLIFVEKDLIFFDKKGSLIRFNESKEKKWVSNNYTKNEIKSKPFLFFEKSENSLLVTDNIANYYALNIENGDLLWTKNNSSPFNSEIKVYKNKFYAVDLENAIHCFSVDDGKEIWSYKTEDFFVKSPKKLSIVIENNVVYFSNSIGDITAINSENGSLIWQHPTQNNQIYGNSFLLKNSELVISQKSIYFSNNNNEFYSINKNNGILNWKQKINSSIKPVIIGNAIITVTKNGFLNILDKVSGNIVRSTDIFDLFKEKKRPQIDPVGFIVGSKKIYLTTTNGRLLIIDIKTGKSENFLKITGEKISKPFINKNKLFIIKDDSIIRFD